MTILRHVKNIRDVSYPSHLKLVHAYKRESIVFNHLWLFDAYRKYAMRIIGKKRKRFENLTQSDGLLSACRNPAKHTIKDERNRNHP